MKLQIIGEITRQNLLAGFRADKKGNIRAALILYAMARAGYVQLENLDGLKRADYMINSLTEDPKMLAEIYEVGENRFREGMERVVLSDEHVQASLREEEKIARAAGFAGY
jgi:hypothetical protein